MLEEKRIAEVRGETSAKDIEDIKDTIIYLTEKVETQNEITTLRQVVNKCEGLIEVQTSRVDHLKKDVNVLSDNFKSYHDRIDRKIDAIEKRVEDGFKEMAFFISKHDKDILKFLLYIIPITLGLLGTTVAAVYWSNYHISQKATDRYIEAMEVKINSELKQKTNQEVDSTKTKK